MSDDGSDFGAFMAGFVIGGLVGAATALILAPQSGAETRAQIAAKGEELKQAGEEQYLEYRDKAETSVAQAQTKVHDTSEQVQERARIVLTEGKHNLRKDQANEDVQASETEIADNQQEPGDESPA